MWVFIEEEKDALLVLEYELSRGTHESLTSSLTPIDIQTSSHANSRVLPVTNHSQVSLEFRLFSKSSPTLNPTQVYTLNSIKYKETNAWNYNKFDTE